MLIANGPDTQTNGRLFAALAEKLFERHRIRLHFRDLPRGKFRKVAYLLRPDFRLLGDVLAANTLVVHTAACLSLPVLALARILGQRCIVFMWDDYSRPGPRNRILATLERAALALCHQALVPSVDYLHSRASRAAALVSVFPLWPCRTARVAPSGKAADRDAIKVVFAGQINRLRGLGSVLETLSGVGGLRFQVHVFSADALPDMAIEPAGLDIIEHGFVPPSVLDELLPEFDIGLVSLDPDLAAPAFPSKIITYFSAGLPVLYHGPEQAWLTGMLENRGLGVVLRAQDRATLERDLKRVREAFPEAQAEYLRHCQLDWTRLAAVL